jgi:hypothetical protein
LTPTGDLKAAACIVASHANGTMAISSNDTRVGVTPF